MFKKPPKTIVSCENCYFSQGLPFPDAEDKEVIRIYCKARHAAVALKPMTKFCDFWEVKKPTGDIELKTEALEKPEQPKGVEEL